VKARDREEAYRKAIVNGRLCEGNEARSARTGRRGAWHCEGLTMLLPVYDDLGDGAEVLWDEHRGKTVKAIKAMVRSKRELPVFQDDD